MKITIPHFEDLLHLFYPHYCAGCGTDSIRKEQFLCGQCLSSLPSTNFEKISGNVVERMFYGRLPLESACSMYYFTKGKLLQHLIHLMKYDGEKKLGILLGELMGLRLIENNRFSNLDLLIPLPMFPEKMKKRGYNQATLLAQGISNITGIPLSENAVLRSRSTESQTRKQRTERWQNVASSFYINDISSIRNKNILLVDDVITTGATLEACGQTILASNGAGLSVASLALAIQ